MLALAQGPARLLLVVLAAMTLLSGCGPASSELTGVPPSGEVAPLVKVGSGGTLFDAPLYLALQRGYFVEQGLTIEVVALPRITSVLTPLLAGQIDVGAVLPSADLFESLRAMPTAPRLVASAGRALPDQSAAALLVSRQVPMPSAQALRGKPFAADLAGAGGLNGLLALDALGLSSEDIAWRHLLPADAAAALANGEVAVAYVLEPEASRLVAEGRARRWLGVDALDPGQDLALIAASPNSVAQRAHLVARWLAAYLQGQRVLAAARRDPAERRLVEAELAQALRLDEPYRARALWTIGYPADPTPHLPSLLALQAYLLDNGLLAAPVDLEREIQPLGQPPAQERGAP